jgi:hypothetical protein
MPFQEKENIVNIFSALFISIGYALMVYQRHLQGKIDLIEDYNVWGYIFLIFIGVSIIARIMIYIIFYIINTIATREEEKAVSDERDKLIKLKATRNSHYAFSIPIMLALVSLAIGMPVYGIFIAFIISCVFSELVDNFSQIYYNRRGVYNG